MVRYIFFVLLIVIVNRIACNGHKSPQPRGPDPSKSAGKANSMNNDADIENGEIGECPADNEQVGFCCQNPKQIKHYKQVQLCTESSTQHASILCVCTAISFGYSSLLQSGPI